MCKSEKLTIDIVVSLSEDGSVIVINGYNQGIPIPSSIISVGKQEQFLEAFRRVVLDDSSMAEMSGLDDETIEVVKHTIGNIKHYLVNWEMFLDLKYLPEGETIQDQAVLLSREIHKMFLIEDLLRCLNDGGNIDGRKFLEGCVEAFSSDSFEVSLNLDQSLEFSIDPIFALHLFELIRNAEKYCRAEEYRKLDLSIVLEFGEDGRSFLMINAINPISNSLAEGLKGVDISASGFSTSADTNNGEYANGGNGTALLKGYVEEREGVYEVFVYHGKDGKPWFKTVISIPYTNIQLVGQEVVNDSV